MSKPKLKFNFNNLNNLNNNITSSPNRNDDQLKLVDLFSGTGVFSHVFLQTGRVQVVFANDLLKISKTIYEQNINHELIMNNINDIKKEDIPDHNILTGGFPCQPFSIAGQQLGFNDSRSNVFWKILDIMKLKRPEIVLLENVKNLVSHDNGNTFNIIINEIKKIGYNIEWKIFDTSKITGIPQHRERIYLICTTRYDLLKKLNLNFSRIEVKPLNSFLESNVDEKYYYTEKSAIFDKLQTSVLKINTIYQYRRTFVRENQSGLCPTLTENMGSGGHNVPIIIDPNTLRIRKLTPRECFNLQGFPNSYKLVSLSDTSLYKLVGNAVSYPVVKLIANEIINNI